MQYVVGSGPAGVACAMALLASGAVVTMLDAGLTLEEERQSNLRNMQGIPEAQWSGDSIRMLSEGMTSGASGIPIKLAYGSDYAYRFTPGGTPVEFENARASASHAAGGLSTVWGSAVLPYRSIDMAGWPIGADALAPAYREIFRWMPLAGTEDDLAAQFPLFCDSPLSLPESAQARRFRAVLMRHRNSLARRGVIFGRSRLAVAASGRNGSSPCTACGLCMYGCPYGLIYSSDRTVDEMRSNPNFTYRPGVIVRQVEETATGVKIRALDRAGNQLEIQGDRVFLATGLYPTTAILLRSMEMYNTPVRIADSQYFLLPLLRVPGARNVTEERLHTLAQLFLEIDDPAVSTHTVHLQTYTYNDLFKPPIAEALGPLRSVFPMNSFLGRLLLFQGYLHSDHSAHMLAILTKRGSDDCLKVTGVPEQETRLVLNNLLRKLVSLSWMLKSVPIVPMLQVGEPGRGYHSGGSFPMRLDPHRGETDIYGRPAGLRRIHAVDSTIFPSIAATTITLSVMANAYRIGLAARYL